MNRAKTKMASLLPGPNFLRIPPFPGHRAGPLASAGVAGSADVDELIAALAEARVGGAFWAARPALPKGRDVVLAPDTQAQAFALLDTAIADGISGRVVVIGPFASTRDAAGEWVPVIARLCDPWHVAVRASAIRAAPVLADRSSTASHTHRSPI